MRTLRIGVIALILLMLTSAGWCTTITAATGTHNWSDTACWVGAALPVSTNDVVIPSGAVVTLDGVYPASGSFLSVNVQAGSTFNIPTNANTGLTLTGDSATGLTMAGKVQHSVGTTIDPAYSCLISITPTTDGGSGVTISSTGANSVVLSGAPKDHFKLLNADCGDWSVKGDAAPTAGAITSITLDSAPSGWVANDILVVAPTGKTYSHWDTVILSSISSAVCTVGSTWQGVAPLYVGAANLPSWCHQGAGNPTQARGEVLNLSRNLKIYSTDATKRTWVNVASTAVCTLNYCECYNSGMSQAKAGFAINTTSGSAALTGVVTHNTAFTGFSANNSTLAGTIALTNCIAWLSSNSANMYVITAWSGAGSLTCTNCISGYSTVSGSQGFSIGDVGSTFPSCRAIGCIGNAFSVAESSATPLASGMLQGCVSHSNGSAGVIFSSDYNTTATPIDSVVLWRNNSYGISTGGGVFYITNPTLFGATFAQVYANCGQVFVSNLTQPADTSYEVRSGQTVNGILAFTGGQVRDSFSLSDFSCIVNNATWTTFSAPSWSYTDGSAGYLLIYRFNQTQDDHRIYYKLGSMLSNQTTRHTATGYSWQHLPTGGIGTWFRPNTVGTYPVVVRANVAITLGCWVYVDSSYNGTAKPRLVALGGQIQGVAADVIGTSHSGTQTWQYLTVALTGANTPTEGGVINLVVEGQGTAGSYYVDDMPRNCEDNFSVYGFSPNQGYSRSRIGNN